MNDRTQSLVTVALTRMKRRGTPGSEQREDKPQNSVWGEEICPRLADLVSGAGGHAAMAAAEVVAAAEWRRGGGVEKEPSAQGTQASFSGMATDGGEWSSESALHRRNTETGFSVVCRHWPARRRIDGNRHHRVRRAGRRRIRRQVTIEESLA